MKSPICLLFCFYFINSNADWAPDPLCPYPSYEPTRFPYIGDCTKYWECMDGTKTALSCPSGFEFNAPLQECDNRQLVNCDPNAITTVTWNPISTQPAPRCPPSTSDELSYLPYIGDCTKYWECYYGLAYLHQCPIGTRWNQYTYVCDLSANVVC